MWLVTQPVEHNWGESDREERDTDTSGCVSHVWMIRKENNYQEKAVAAKHGHDRGVTQQSFPLVDCCFFFPHWRMFEVKK